jgi:hypothetical protein
MITDTNKMYILNSDEVWTPLPGRGTDVAWGPFSNGEIFAIGTNNSGRDGFGVWNWNWDTQRWN